MNRITDKDLQAACDRINRMMGTPAALYATNDDGVHMAQIGCFHLSHAYGGVCLHQMMNLSGGCRSVLGGGYVTKREMYEKLHAYIAGLQDQLDRLWPNMI
jgi:acetoin utilization deacetylase AcuC-like enzyme